MGNVLFKYAEPLQTFDWKILEETKVILGYKYQKAGTYYAGRNYIAWFTNQIPISEGPYKFNGLSGLIVQIEDTKGYYKFALTSFEKNTNKKQRIETQDIKYKVVSRKKFFEMEKIYYKNFEKILMKSPNIKISPNDPKGTEKFGAMLRKSKENPLKLSVD